MMMARMIRTRTPTTEAMMMVVVVFQGLMFVSQREKTKSQLFVLTGSYVHEPIGLWLYMHVLLLDYCYQGSKFPCLSWETLK